ncbi:hypothetical protein [Nocardioides sp. 616]|uniref:hypothetical protein n=1 Tax=Nocardioides sp. 616 TaxID=2268090 RepID=UPI0013B42039|nr:hypothetical protein [Nocardioides sp. 616]
MNPLLRSWDRLYIYVAVIGLVAIVSHWSLIWHHPVPDFDTDTLIGQAPGNCGKPWILAGMGDTAHPLGNALIQQYICLWDGSSTVNLNQAWALLLVAAVTGIALLLLMVSWRTGAGPLSAAVALGYVGTSPALRTLSARAEEDWIGLTLFVLVTVLVLLYHRADTGLSWRLAGIAVATTLLAVWHFQYMLVLAFGLTPWAVLAMAKPRWAGTTRRKAIALGVAMAVPSGATLGTLFGTGYAVRVEYHKLYLSIFNPDYWEGILHWLRNYTTYSSRWLTGWLGNDGQQEKLFAAPETWPFVVLGLVALATVVLLLVFTRNAVLIAIGFGCLVLPFLFEPHNAERWDPTSVIVALALAHGVSTCARGAHPVEPVAGELAGEPEALGVEASPPARV